MSQKERVMENLKRIQIGEHTYPIKMDLNVLEQIQERYDSINRFEMELLGLGLVKDENGRQVIGEEGKPKYYQKDPSIKAIRTAITPMINEGLEIEAQEQNRSWESVTAAEIEADMDYGKLMELSGIIHDEFSRCFFTKKSDPAETEPETANR
jgi:hypothetical protein